jgi:hypothetical protein
VVNAQIIKGQKGEAWVGGYRAPLVVRCRGISSPALINELFALDAPRDVAETELHPNAFASHPQHAVAPPVFSGPSRAHRASDIDH